VQGWDRYAYTNNNPVRYTDPSGNLVCSDPHVADGDCSDEGAGLWRYNITLIGDWTKEDRLAAREAAYAVGSKLGEETNNTPWESFKETYSYVYLTWGLEGAERECATISAGGCTTSAHQINFMTLAKPGGYKTEIMAALEARNNIVHEFGHAFADLWYKSDGSYDPSGPYMNIDEDLLVEGGFHDSPSSARLTWRQHPGDTSPNEIFADMFLGWTFNAWGNNELGNDRSTFMTTHMTQWIK
jgi:hypothetical protein